MDAMDTTGTQQQTTGTEAQTAESQAGEQQAAQEAQTENLSDEARVAAEALALTEEPAEESPEIEALKREDERLIGSITAKRALNRELDRQIAEKMASEKASQPSEPSPEQKYIDENKDNFDPNTEPFPASVQMAQRKWEREQETRQRQQQEETSVTTAANKAYLQARQKYSDFDEIVMEAEDLLTEGDKVDIRNAAKNGEDPAEMLYQRCIYKTLMAGGSRARELRAKLKKKLPAKASAQKQETKENQSGGSEKKPSEEKPASIAEKQEVKNPALAHIYAAFGRED